MAKALTISICMMDLIFDEVARFGVRSYDRKWADNYLDVPSCARECKMCLNPVRPLDAEKYSVKYNINRVKTRNQPNCSIASNLA